MEDHSAQIRGSVSKAKLKIPPSFWIWCGTLAYFLLVLHNSSDFYSSFFAALIALVLIEGVRSSRKMKASDLLSKRVDATLYDAIAHPLSVIGTMLLVAAFYFYLLAFFLVPITCDMQKGWLGRFIGVDFLSSKVCTMQVEWVGTGPHP